MWTTGVLLVLTHCHILINWLIGYPRHRIYCHQLIIEVPYVYIIIDIIIVIDYIMIINNLEIGMVGCWNRAWIFSKEKFLLQENVPVMTGRLPRSRETEYSALKALKQQPEKASAGKDMLDVSRNIETCWFLLMFPHVDQKATNIGW